MDAAIELKQIFCLVIIQKLFHTKKKNFFNFFF